MKFIIPILFLSLFAPFSAEWDLALAHYFYENSFASNELWTFLFLYGPIPANITAAGGLILLIGSLFYKPIVPYRKILLLLTMTLAIGSGLIAHAMLKDNWGRPRPRQVIEFGGKYTFHPFYKPNFSGGRAFVHDNDILRSFPCGHCTMGFYFFALALAFRRLGRNKLSLCTYFFAFSLGILLSISRMAVGGHYLSDTLVSLVIMWLTASSLDAILFKKGEPIAVLNS